MSTAIKNLKAKIEEAIASTPTGISFVHIGGYTNKKGEISDVLINVGIDLDKAKQKDVETLKELDTSSIDVPQDAGFTKSELETARDELLARLVAPSKSTQNRSKGQSDAYNNIAPGIREHKESGKIFVYGMKVRKTVREKGDYGEDTRKPLTKAKDYIRFKYLKAPNFRQYEVDGDPTVDISGDTMDNLVIHK